MKPEQIKQLALAGGISVIFLASCGERKEAEASPASENQDPPARTANTDTPQATQNEPTEEPQGAAKDNQPEVLKNAGFPTGAVFQSKSHMDVQGLKLGCNLEQASALIADLRAGGEPGEYRGTLNGFDVVLKFSRYAMPGACHHINVGRSYETPPDWDQIDAKIVEKYGEPDHSDREAKRSHISSFWGATNVREGFGPPVLHIAEHGVTLRVIRTITGSRRAMLDIVLSDNDLKRDEEEAIKSESSRAKARAEEKATRNTNF